MIRKQVYLFILISFIRLFLFESAFSFEGIKPENKYRDVLILENKDVYGVTDQKTEDGKYIPAKLIGEEKVKVILYEFTMKDDVTIDMVKSDKTHKTIIDILTTENESSVKLLREWLKDKNPHNRDKAAYLLDAIGDNTN
jgi:hypothetical protein